ncbi:hypothetical protein TNCV_833161 [Trichonephila clavipes]|uniref:Uncharacterized protein n=1 Tax=Trichonephila clavipes TaxID=2585209 RepID=A0A8X6RBG6_TRICX|nr:hypothetical protein TNCV_833161 [Trichonephila clavipes]
MQLRHFVGCVIVRDGLRIASFVLATLRSTGLFASMFDGLVAFAMDRWRHVCGARGVQSYHVRVTNVGGKIRSEYLPFRTLCHFNLSHRILGEVAEWLRRWTANPLGSARVGLLHHRRDRIVALYFGHPDCKNGPQSHVRIVCDVGHDDRSLEKLAGVPGPVGP